MARGESPYKGQYTVPTIDFSPLERSGAAWGEAFKGIGQQIEKFQLNKQKRNVLEESLQGKVEALMENDPKAAEALLRDESFNKDTQRLATGEMKLSELEGLVGKIEGYSGETTNILQRKLAASQARSAAMTATGQEWLQSYRIAGVEQVDAVTNRIEAGLQKRRESWINELVDKNKLSPADAAKQWRDTMAGKERQQLLSDLSRPDKTIMAQADLFRAGTAVPLRGDHATKLISDLGNLGYQYDLEQARRKATPVAEKLAQEEEEAEMAKKLKRSQLRLSELKEESEAQGIEAGAMAILEAELELQALPEKQRQEQRERENKITLDDLEIRDRKAARKLLKKHPEGRIFQQELDDGTMVNMFYTGQSYQIVDAGQYTESQRIAASVKIFGPKIAEYYAETRTGEGVIDDPEDMNPDMERLLLQMQGALGEDGGWPKDVKDEDGVAIPMYELPAPWLPTKKPSGANPLLITKKKKPKKPKKPKTP